MENTKTKQILIKRITDKICLSLNEVDYGTYELSSEVNGSETFLNIFFDIEEAVEEFENLSQKLTKEAIMEVLNSV